MSNKPKERKSGFYIIGRGINRKFCTYSADTKRFYELYPRASNPLKDDEITAIDEREIIDQLKTADEMRQLLKELSELENYISLNEIEDAPIIQRLINKAKQFLTK